MTVYAIAQLRFTDRSAYDRYQNRFLGVFAKYAGTILAADEADTAPQEVPYGQTLRSLQRSSVFT